MLNQLYFKRRSFHKVNTYFIHYDSFVFSWVKLVQPAAAHKGLRKGGERRGQSSRSVANPRPRPSAYLIRRHGHIGIAGRDVLLALLNFDNLRSSQAKSALRPIQAAADSDRGD